MCMMLVMLPFFLLGVYEKNGQPLEKVAGNIIRASILRPRQRPYRTNNFYALLGDICQKYQASFFTFEWM